jgi:hypothetical protein
MLKALFPIKWRLRSYCSIYITVKQRLANFACYNMYPGHKPISINWITTDPMLEHTSDPRYQVLVT